MKLIALSVTLAKLPRRGTRQRDGYQNEEGLVFMPPRSAKRVSAWRKKLADRGILVPEK